MAHHEKVKRHLALAVNADGGKSESHPIVSLIEKFAGARSCRTIVCMLGPPRVQWYKMVCRMVHVWRVYAVDALCGMG